MLFIPSADFSVKVPLAAKRDRAGKVDQTPLLQRLHVEAFCIDRTEVPMSAYRPDLCGKPDRDCMLSASYIGPAACVSQLQAQCQCENAVAGAAKRLPTDPEWILAALGTDNREFPWGNSAYPEGYRVGQNFCPPQANVPTRAMMCPVEANVLDVSPFGVIGMGTNGTEMTATCVVSEALTPRRLRCVDRGADLEEGPLHRTDTWPQEQTPLTAAPNRSFRCATSVRAAP